MDWWADLDTALDEVWRRLERGVADRKAAARHPVLATQGLGGFAEARTVVLRAADRGAARLTLHTDAASGKMAEIRAQPGATLLVWEEKARLQIRLRVTVSIAPEAEAEAAWARVPDPSRRVYRSLPPPGEPIPDPEGAAEGEESRFTLLHCRIAEIETLHLGEARHRRALFRASDGWQGQWLAP